MTDKITLYSFIGEKGWEELRSKGALIHNGDYGDDIFVSAYEWMAAKKWPGARILWGWAHRFPAHALQRMNDPKQPTIKEVLVTLQKAPADTLLSNFYCWENIMAVSHLCRDMEAKELKMLYQVFQAAEWQEVQEEYQQDLTDLFTKVGPDEEDAIQGAFLEISNKDILDVQLVELDQKKRCQLLNEHLKAHPKFDPGLMVWDHVPLYMSEDDELNSKIDDLADNWAEQNQMAGVTLTSIWETN